MKKVLVLMLVFVMLFTVGAFAKKKTSFEKAITGEDVDWAKQESIITTNPLALAFGSFNAHYEMKMGPMNGLGFNGNFYFYGVGGWSYMGVGISGEYNWYFQEHALNGWYAGPMAGVSLYSFNYEYDTYDISTGWTATKDSATSFAINIGGKGGYRWIWDNGFTVDANVGFMANIGGGATIGGIAAPILPVTPVFGANVGYAF